MRSPRDNDVARRTRFEQLYEAHHAAVLADALRRAERTVAHDVTAETFLVAWRWLEVVPCRRDALAVRGGRRVLANERRAESRRAALAERMRAVWLSQPHGDAAARDGLLRAALARLPEHDREALALVAWEGLSTAQAARAMECAPTAMRVRLHRARRRQARALDDVGPAPATSSRSRSSAAAIRGSSAGRMRSRRLRAVGVAVQLEPGHCAPVAVDQPDAEIVRGRGLVFRDSWGNLVEVVQYDAIQFSKTAGVLRGMGLGGIGKTAAARREISEKGLS